MKRKGGLKGIKVQMLNDRIKAWDRHGDARDDNYSLKLSQLRPTPLDESRPATPIELDPLPKRLWWRPLWCIGIVLGFLFARWLAKLSRRLDPERDAKRTRALFEKLGGMWIKLGQLLSLRNDLFTDAMCRELGALQYKMHGFPTAVALDVLREDLGSAPDRVFSHFDPHPFAAASICQVHHAILARNGRAVVVKIMRPDVQRGFAGDLRLLQFVVLVLKAFGLASRLRLDEGLRQLRTLLREETDYSYEVVNLKRMRKSLKAHKIIVPKVFADFCRPRVLVMEEIPGVLMSQYIAARRDDPDRLHRWERENAIEPRRIAEKLLITTMRQILEDNLFHGDLHPGNIMLMSENRIALIDFGTVGRMETQAWLIYRQVSNAMASADFDRAADYMLMLAPSVPALGTPDLRRNLSDAMRLWESRSRFAGGAYSERSMGALSVQTARLMARYKVPPTWEMMRVGRALGTLDASLQTLSPDGNFLKLYGAYFKDRAKRLGTLRGRIKTTREAVAALQATMSDANILLSPQIRQQALRLKGMTGGISLLRFKMLQVVRIGLLTVLGVLGLQFVVVHHAHDFPDFMQPVLAEIAHMLSPIIVDIHYLQWLILGAAALFALHVIRVAQDAVTNHE